MAQIIAEHNCAPDENLGECHYYGSQTGRLCYTCKDRKRICSDPRATEKTKNSFVFSLVS
jgi:hypothetical protein